jgi:hypothetical protein
MYNNYSDKINKRKQTLFEKKILTLHLVNTVILMITNS